MTKPGSMNCMRHVTLIGLIRILKGRLWDEKEANIKTDF
jgi:hypothetical protein